MSALPFGPELLREHFKFHAERARLREQRSERRQRSLDVLIETHERLRHLGREEHGGHYACACPTGLLIKDLLDTPSDSPFLLERRDGVVLFEGAATDCWGR